MALKAIIDNLEGVAEGLRDNYRAGTKEEGLESKFVLQVDGADGWALENVSGLKTALGRERTRADNAEKKVAKFGDLDPDTVKTSLDRLTELESLDPKKEADRLAQAKIDAATKQLVEKHNQEMQAIAGREGKLRSTVETLMIDNVAIKALEGHKGNVDLLLPHVKSQVRLKEGEDGVVEVIDREGNVRIGDAQGKPMTVDQLVAEMSKSDKFAQGFSGNNHSGSGTPGGGGNGGDRKPAGNFGGTRTDRTNAIAQKFDLPLN